MAYTPGLATSTDQRGKVKRKFFDAFNQLVQVDEIKGSETYVTTYTYDAAGSLRTVTNALGHVTQMTYDLLGRKDTMQDPNMGFWIYAYNLAGDLTRQTDARNIPLDFTYDALGRVTTKTQGAITLVTWRYDTPAPGDPAVPFSVGRLTKVVDNSAVTRILGYDAMGRVTQTRRNIDGLTYDMSQSYDALSRITQETFPDSESAFYNYNSAGWLCSVGTSLSSTCAITGGYVNNITYNARDQKTSLLYANGLTTTWSYHPNNFRLTDLHTGVGGAHTPVALTGWVGSWSTVEPLPPPSGFSNLYRGGICVANGTGSCIGGDSTLESGVGAPLGHIRNTSAVNTVPVYRSTCYSSGGVCTGWGLSLDVSGAAVGYLSTVAPDSQSATQPFIQSNGLLLQGLTGTASGYLWSPTTQTVNHTDHFYVTTGQAPSGYTSEGTTGYIDDTSSTGTVALARYVNSTTGHHYYSAVNDPPAGFASEATVGYLHTTGGSGLAALYRHHNSTTGDYLLSTSATPPGGYVLQATLGYIHPSPTSGGNAQDLTYNYDQIGNVTAITDAMWTGSRSFVYDDLNRLTQATGNFGGTNQSLVTHNYAYDAIGNITDKAGVTYCYGYMTACSDLNRLSGVKSTSDGSTYTYDANGNMATGAGRTYTWTADNRMDVVNAPTGSAIMSYDYTGIRVKKSGTAGTTIFPFTGYEVQGTLVTKYIRMGNEIIASKKDGVGKLFYHNDHLGGVNVITDATAVKVQLNEYDPWGKVSRSEGTTEPTHGFTGQELDPESNIHYYGGRYYDQALSRFVSPDPFVQDPDDPQNLNRYSYVLNSPQNYIDPSGYFFDDIPFGDVSGFSSGFSFNFSGSSPSWAAANIGFSGFSICPAGCGSEFGADTPDIEMIKYPPKIEWNGIISGSAGQYTIFDGTKNEAGLGTPWFGNLDDFIPQNLSLKGVKLVAAGIIGGLKKLGGELVKGIVVKQEGLIYRAASGTAKSMTPRAKDFATGLSAADSLKSALSGKNQVIDTSKFKSLCAICDNPTTGHVTIIPKDASQMQGWISSRGSTNVHPLTRELMDAVVDTVTK